MSLFCFIILRHNFWKDVFYIRCIYCEYVILRPCFTNIVFQVIATPEAAAVAENGSEERRADGDKPAEVGFKHAFYTHSNYLSYVTLQNTYPYLSFIY